jgi:hypothetical protein
VKAGAEDEFVVVGVFRSTPDAELAGTRLQASGIPVSISADDCGGMRPQLQLTQGVRLLVPVRFERRARRLLGERR